MELIEVKQVRFSKLVEQGGEPAAYLPFGDPEKDKSFMRAVKEQRVVTIKQERPVSTKILELSVS